MTACQSRIIETLYGEDVWAGFTPSGADEPVQGWNGDHPVLRQLASAAGAHVIIDVGVWKGQSTINQALGLKAAGIDGCVIAIDTFLGSAEHWPYGRGQFFRRRHGQPDLFEMFLSNVVRAGVQDYVVPMPQTSATAALVLARLSIRATVVHIDAAHEYPDVIRDALDYWALVEPGGYLIGDDYHESWSGVIQAAGEFAERNGLDLTIDNGKWIVRKPPAG